MIIINCQGHIFTNIILQYDLAFIISYMGNILMDGFLENIINNDTK